MGQYRVSELNLEVNTNSSTLKSNLERYKTSFDYKPNVVLSISDDRLIQLMEEYEGVSADVLECEFMAAQYARDLFDFNGFPMYACGVSYGGSAVLFSSPFEKANVDEAVNKDMIITADLSSVRLIGRDIIVYDNPFGMKGHLSHKTRLPLKSIVFVDSERFDSLKRLDANSYIPMFLRSVSLSIKGERIKHTLYVLEKIMNSITFFGVGDLSDVDFVLERVTEY